MRDEAEYFILPGFLAQIDAHDMNSRQVTLILHFLACNESPLEFYYTINQLRRERYSILAITAEHQYNMKNTTRVLSLYLDARDDSYHHPRNSFDDFGSQIAIENGPFGVNFLLIKRGKATRNFIIQCALKTMEIYLKTGDFAVEFSACLFEKELEKDFEAYAEIEVTADSESGLNWIAVHNMIDGNDGD